MNIGAPIDRPPENPVSVLAVVVSFVAGYATFILLLVILRLFGVAAAEFLYGFPLIRALQKVPLVGYIFHETLPSWAALSGIFLVPPFVVSLMCKVHRSRPIQAYKAIFGIAIFGVLNALYQFIADIMGGSFSLEPLLPAAAAIHLFFINKRPEPVTAPTLPLSPGPPVPTPSSEGGENHEG